MDLQNYLRENNQEHLLAFWDDLSESDREHLKCDIASLNLPQINEYFRRSLESTKEISEKLDDYLKPIPAEAYESVPCMPKERVLEYEDIGLHEISHSKVGVLLLAGGQATRLGFGFPKGMYDIGLPSKKTLFQILGERLIRLQNMALEHTGRKGMITWYIMTSEHTIQPTKDFFLKHNNFGLDKDSIVYFQQGTLPCFDFDGKILLDNKHHISCAPDGNGGLYRALKSEGILDDINRRGIEHLHAHSVDNILTKVADPVFIGYCKLKGADCAAKVVPKSSPHEAVGVVCKVDGKYKVVEYSELSTEAAEQRNNDGTLKYSAGNICNHYFSSEFLKRICDLDDKLKLHVAKKKIPYIDSTGAKQKPTEPNGIKMEKFIFDVFEFSNNFACLEVARDIEFSALKNSDSVGKDCPSTAKDDILKLHRKYVQQAGGVVDNNIELEISPLVSYGGENLENLVKGEVFAESPFHLKSPQEAMANGFH